MSIKKIWKNRKQILEGIKNSVFKKEHIEKTEKKTKRKTKKKKAVES